MILFNEGNIFYRGYRYLLTGSREFIVKYIIFDVISDTIFNLCLGWYINLSLRYISNINIPVHSCLSKNCYHNPIILLSKDFCQQNGIIEIDNNNYLIKFLNQAKNAIHFHGVSKIIGIGLSPIIYGMREILINILEDDSVVYDIGNNIVKVGQFMGINPYESVFAVDKLINQNNMFIQFVAQNDIIERKNNSEYSKFMDFVNNIWIESFVDAIEHGFEYYFIFDKLFEYRSFFSHGLNSEDITYFVNQQNLGYKVLSVIPIIIGGYLLNFNTKEKEKFLEISYKPDAISNDKNSLNSFEENNFGISQNDKLEICFIYYSGYQQVIEFEQ